MQPLACCFAQCLLSGKAPAANKGFLAKIREISNPEKVFVCVWESPLEGLIFGHLTDSYTVVYTVVYSKLIQSFLKFIQSLIKSSEARPESAGYPR